MTILIQNTVTLHLSKENCISNSDAVYSFNWTSLFRLAQVKTHKYLKELQITPDSYLLWSDLATLVDIRQGSVVTCFD